MPRRTLLVLPILIATAAQTAEAQPAQLDSVGRFGVQAGADPITDEDHSWAAVADEANGVHLYWACKGAALSIQLQPQPADAGRSVVWRFDRDEPRTGTWLRTGRGGRVTRLPRAEAYAFTVRARTAARLVIRQEVDGARHDWFFDLRGSDRALSRLPCVRALRPPVLGARDPGATRPRDEPPPYKVRAVEDEPRLLNGTEIAAALASAVPGAVRATGGSVVLRLLVREDGTADADGAVVVRSSDPALGEVALRLVPRMRFTPARVNGRPVRAWVEMPSEVLPAH